jgi:hypothetical protein
VFPDVFVRIKSELTRKNGMHLLDTVDGVSIFQRVSFYVYYKAGVLLRR